MKKLIYTFLMVAGAMTTLLSCGNSAEPVATLLTAESTMRGDQYWYLGFADEKVPVVLEPTDCDTIFKIAVPVTFRLNEVVSMPENVVAEYKEIYMGIYNSGREFGDMKTNEEGLQAIKKLLSGKVGDKESVTFVSEKSLTRSEIEKSLQYSESFYVRDMDFTVNGKLHMKELFNYVFNGEDLDVVIDNFAVMVNELRDAYLQYEENGTSKEYDALIKIYKEAYIMSDKIEASVDEYNVSKSQYNRLSRAVEAFYEIYQEM